LAKPDFLISDFAKFDRPAQLHLAFQALYDFVEKHGRYPKPRNEDDANEVFEKTKEMAENSEDKPELDEKLIKELAYESQGELSPMVAVFGGMAAQEVLKAVSGKFSPIQQCMYFDALEALPVNSKLSEELCAPVSIIS
jgi:ubiquitin-activating enzyme E1